MKSDTMDTSAVEVKLSDGRTVYLIDTIGFGGSGVDHSHTDLAARYIDFFQNKSVSFSPFGPSCSDAKLKQGRNQRAQDHSFPLLHRH